MSERESPELQVDHLILSIDAAELEMLNATFGGNRHLGIFI